MLERCPGCGQRYDGGGCATEQQLRPGCNNNNNTLKKSCKRASTYSQAHSTCKHSQPWSGHGTQGDDLQDIQPGWGRGGHRISFFLLPPALTIVQLIRKGAKRRWRLHISMSRRSSMAGQRKKRHQGSIRTTEATAPIFLLRLSL